MFLYQSFIKLNSWQNIRFLPCSMPTSKFNNYTQTIEYEYICFFYRLFLGPCDGEDVIDTLKRSSTIDSHKVALRFNSTKVDYKSVAGKPVLGRVIQLKTCHVRVDIYNSMLLGLFNYSKGHILI